MVVAMGLRSGVARDCRLGLMGKRRGCLALEPRLLVPTLLGLYLLLPRIRRRLHPRKNISSAGNVIFPLIGVMLIALLFFAHPYPKVLPEQAQAQLAQPSSSPENIDNDWRYYGRTPRGERWSPLTQISQQNVDQLEPAWEYRTGDVARSGENKDGYEFNFEVTPIKAGDTLYICTPHSQVIALDAVSGAERWRFDPKPETGNNAYLACRGVAYYEAPAGTECPQRIISPVADARLVALDASATHTMNYVYPFSFAQAVADFLDGDNHSGRIDK